jgi:hypothetical protein
MRTLFVGALAATVVGYSCYAPAQANIGACTAGGLPALAGAPSVRRLNRKRLRSTLPKTRSKTAAITEKPPSARARHETVSP